MAKIIKPSVSAEHYKMSYVPGFFAAVSERDGWTNFYIVDEHGCGLHTEVVCTVPTGHGHKWFANWLQGQKTSVSWPSLLTHADTVVRFRSVPGTEDG